MIFFFIPAYEPTKQAENKAVSLSTYLSNHQDPTGIRLVLLYTGVLENAIRLKKYNIPSPTKPSTESFIIYSDFSSRDLYYI